MPDFDIRAQLVPASPDVIIALLQDYGTMSFAQVAAPAIRMAREGFPAHQVMTRNMELSLEQRIGYCFLLSYNCQVYLHGEWWRPFQHADRVTVPDLAKTLEALAQAEQQAISTGGSRQEGLQATRHYFYQGPLAEAIVDYHAGHGGLMSAADLADYSGSWEEPIQASYGEYTVYVNGTWTQGIVLPMALHTLEGIDLESMGHNSPEYIHSVVQAIELAQADRDAYVADAAFVDVPVDVLLSPDYAASRQAMMGDSAFPQLPPPGSIPGYGGAISPATTAALVDQPSQDMLSGFMHHKDTTQLAIIDPQGNVVVMTPSDFPKSPMIPGTGMTLGDRMTQFRLDPDDVDALAPGKRPRVTPNAVIVFRNGEFWMGFSTEGGDMQPQALLQVFLNMTVFEMDIQEAINAPRFKTLSAPSSFSPHVSYPAFVQLEADFYDQAVADLLTRGYTMQKADRWGLGFGKVGAVIRDGDRLYAGSDPRGETTAAGR
jgi:gamma-glutamyltranspeptidase/glutathione hydrolase